MHTHTHTHMHTHTDTNPYSTVSCSVDTLLLSSQREGEKRGMKKGVDEKKVEFSDYLRTLWKGYRLRQEVNARMSVMTVALGNLGVAGRKQSLDTSP